MFSRYIYVWIVLFFFFGMSLGASFVYAKFAPEEVQPTDFQNRGTRSYIYQSEGVLSASEEIHQDFTYIITETSPSVQGAFIEITGIAYQASTTGTRGLVTSIDDTTLSSTRTSFFHVSATPKGKEFHILYDVSEYVASQVTTSGEYTFTWDSYFENVDVTTVSAEFVTTYQYEPINAQMPIWGTLESTIFDTTSTQGAAYNSLMWRGALGVGGEGRVRLQFATSDCENGASNAPMCDIGTWEFIGGTSCSIDGWYEPEADTPLNLHSTGCLPVWNDKRYFRYKVQICSVDCVIAGQSTPTVEEVLVNWSP